MVGAWQDTAWRKKYKGMKPDALADAITRLTAEVARLEQYVGVGKGTDNFLARTRELEIATRVERSRSTPDERRGR